MNQITLKVKEVVQETSDTVTIKLKQPLFKKVQYQAGQFLTVITEVEGQKLRRSYSMSSAPHLDATIDITVKRILEGKVSNHLNDNVKVGDMLEVVEPMGQFLYDPSKEAERHMVLWGAGSGITPLFSMLKSCLFFEPKSKVTLVFGNRNEDSIIFKEALEELKEKFQERLDVVHVLSQPSVQWGGFSGRIDDVVAINIMNRLALADSEHYLCGPDGMMDAVTSALKRNKIPTSKIFKESFTPVSGSDHSDDVSPENITLVVDGEEHSVFVSPNQTILEAALEEGLDVPYSCQNGVCTACRANCSSGKVEMGDTMVLSQSEIDNGDILTCISHPLSGNVKITYD
ncbi:ferredoxin--NADP reductase [Flammeovirga sp. EKP202]|uniref:ferredoxin--NADP reductase n=1 Tax=Flammeovirga sp. EKP202 TaxID=2770592 RepID=UPI00165FBC03|nr:ferredoxin--NADP reductase [Flammeovirga sp. EKP202]MBD0402575.1 ferredoxin--NADP reductase [Flammeovirga sp. EKP202]